jgi:hypothetical protein
LALVFLGLFVSYADHKTRQAGFTIAAYSLHAGLLAMAMVACAVVSRSGPRDILSRVLQSLGKLSYGAYLIHPIFAFIGIKIAMKLGRIEAAPVVAIALCAPCAYLLHRWFELPILASRSIVENSRRLRYLSAGLQVTPILVGLTLFFPYRELYQKATAIPQVLDYLAIAVALGALTVALHGAVAALSRNRAIYTVFAKTRRSVSDTWRRFDSAHHFLGRENRDDGDESAPIGMQIGDRAGMEPTERSRAA